MDKDVDHSQHQDGENRVDEAAAQQQATNGAGGAAPDLATVWRTLIDDLPPSQRAWLTASRPTGLGVAPMCQRATMPCDCNFP